MADNSFMPSWKKLSFCLASFLISIFCCYLLSELILGSIPDVPWNTPENWVVDPQIGPWNKKNYQDSYRTSEFNNTIHWNSFGMRDKERQLEKKKDSYRIAFLGDSYTEGLEVSDLETFTRRIEKKINAQNLDVEALNFGKGSMGTTAEFLTYTHKVVPFKPDLVVLVFFPGNDVRNNSLQLQKKYKNNDSGGPYPFYLKNNGDNGYHLILPPVTTASPFREFLKDNFKAYRFWRFLRDVFFVHRSLQKKESGAGDAVTDGVWGAPVTAEWNDAWEITEAVLSRLNQAVRKEGSSLVLAVLPGSGLEMRAKRETDSGQNWRYPVTRLTGWAKKENVPIIDLDTSFLEKIKSTGSAVTDLYYSKNKHFTSLGHEWTAEFISEILIQNYLRINGTGSQKSTATVRAKPL